MTETVPLMSVPLRLGQGARGPGQFSGQTAGRLVQALHCTAQAAQESRRAQMIVVGFLHANGNN